MPNIAQILKAEISRISRHEAKVAISPMGSFHQVERKQGLDNNLRDGSSILNHP